jgi:hypothetical protein
MKRSLISAGALVGAIASIAVILPSPAMAAAPEDLGPRVERACLRIPNIEIRTANLIGRLEGDATVRGSLAWLQTQIDNAETRGRAELVTVLENRLAVRQQTLEVLQQRQAELPRLKQWCIDHGVDL